MKNVLITGTSRGIGFELAQLFARNNYNVLAVSRNSTPLKKLNLKNISCISSDISEVKGIEKIAMFINEHMEHIDILINNAGKLINKPFKELTSSDFMEVYKVNVFAVAELTRQLLPYFSKDSHVVNISSI
jgi:short-subunit dehydrogenase